MLNCRDVAHEASDYIDHNLSGWRRLWFRLHLFICFKCRRFVRHVLLTRNFMGQRPRVPAEDEQVQRVLRAVQHRDHS